MCNYNADSSHVYWQAQNAVKYQKSLSNQVQKLYFRSCT